MKTSEPPVESVREVLTELARKNDGTLTPQIVLAEAEKKKSPLHTYFQWDDTEAALAWRLDQASRLIRRVRVNIEVSENKTLNVRAFYNVTPAETDGDTDGEETESEPSVYVPIHVAMTDYREQIMAQALAELRQIRNKYAHLTQLAEVWDAIEKV